MSYPRLLSFSLDSWSVLGGQVTVSLTDGVAVLVGRNGAGKSAILEGLEVIADLAIGLRFRRIHQDDLDGFPKKLSVLILTPTQRYLEYQYEFLPYLSTTLTNDEAEDIDETEDASEEEAFSWNEECKYVDGKQEKLWATEAGITTLYHQDRDPETMILGSTNSLRRIRMSGDERTTLTSDEMRWVYEVLRGIRLLGKTPVRRTHRRRPAILKASGRGVYGSVLGGLGETLSRKILRLVQSGDLDEVEGVCQRIGLGHEITVQKFVLSNETGRERQNKDEDYLSSVLLDGTNVGLLSDGTLRILSILIDIVKPSPCATIIIEEPEMQIHPEMLSKLLREIESYTFEDNLIISTHSPQVVDWTEPDKINLIFRDNQRTFVRKLVEDELSKVVDYLCEEGDLGEWLYSGVLDE